MAEKKVGEEKGVRRGNMGQEKGSGGDRMWKERWVLEERREGMKRR